MIESIGPAPVRMCSPGGGFESRARLLDLSVGLVEDLRHERVFSGKGPEGYCPHFQVCLPYRGLFVWYVAGDEIVGDPNQVVFVKGDESYRMSAPCAGGYSELIITPDRDVLSEIAHANGWPLSKHPLFTRRTWRMNPGLQTFRMRFLNWATSRQARHDIEAEELVLALLRSALQQNRVGNGRNGATTARLIRRSKEFLAAELSNRILLADVARAAGASPAYLTDLFSRVEGVSLHQYLTQLRLSRALADLPHTNDLTALALDLGFSSHSHFSFAFRRAFGCTPSKFRTATRQAAPPSHVQDCVDA